MSLDFEYTCPKIDAAIEMANHHFDEVVKSLIDRLPIEEQQDILNDTYQEFDYIKDQFEELRTLNEDMRSAAEKQIDDLNDELSEARDEIDDLKKQIEELENEKDELKSQLYESKIENERFENEINDLAQSI